MTQRWKKGVFVDKCECYNDSWLRVGLQAKAESGGYESVALSLALQNVSKDKIKLVRVLVNGRPAMREEGSECQVVVMPGQMHRVAARETRGGCSERLVEMQVQYSRCDGNHERLLKCKVYLPLFAFRMNNANSLYVAERMVELWNGVASEWVALITELMAVDPDLVQSPSDICSLFPNMKMIMADTVPVTAKPDLNELIGLFNISPTAAVLIKISWIDSKTWYLECKHPEHLPSDQLHTLHQDLNTLLFLLSDVTHPS